MRLWTPLALKYWPPWKAFLRRSSREGDLSSPWLKPALHGATGSNSNRNVHFGRLGQVPLYTQPRSAWPDCFVDQTTPRPPAPDPLCSSGTDGEGLGEQVLAGALAIAVRAASLEDVRTVRTVGAPAVAAPELVNDLPMVRSRPVGLADHLRKHRRVVRRNRQHASLASNASIQCSRCGTVLRAMLFRSTSARHRIRHGIRHTAARV